MAHWSPDDWATHMSPDCRKLNAHLLGLEARPKVALTTTIAPPAEPYVAYLDAPRRPVVTPVYRSKTEQRFAEQVLEVQRANGIAQRWWYEALTLWIFPATQRDNGRYTPDFVVQRDTDAPFPLRADMPLTITPELAQRTRLFERVTLDVYEIKLEGQRYRKQNDLDRLRMCPQLYPDVHFHLAMWCPKSREWRYTTYRP